MPLLTLAHFDQEVHYLELLKVFLEALSLNRQGRIPRPQTIKVDLVSRKRPRLLS
jgi:hypothetical protein